MNSAIRYPSDRYPIIRTALSETRPKQEESTLLTATRAQVVAALAYLGAERGSV
ncbi:hypothetical protein [Dietzia cinnamea]|uniref:Uncharacterized protein n=1 Tax=Dietzia cinnamea TaxID=321318 RepID=A0A4R3ZSD8_9ACTN|nr:hypothetical protein [Dietzia cinnamea]TCW23167.1 hypothetical protein EDD19_11595 [Dietzia cinnamea]